MDSCCLQLVLKNAAKGGKEDITYTFQIENPVVKKDWITELRLAQLALDPNNSPAWQMGAEHEQRYSLAKMPLFVKAYPAFKSQHQTEVSERHGACLVAFDTFGDPIPGLEYFQFIILSPT